jgi:hypothetical protein
MAAPAIRQHVFQSRRDYILNFNALLSAASKQAFASFSLNWSGAFAMNSIDPHNKAYWVSVPMNYLTAAGAVVAHWAISKCNSAVLSKF